MTYDTLTRTHFCYKIVHCGIFAQCVVGFVNYVNWHAVVAFRTNQTEYVVTVSFYSTHLCRVFTPLLNIMFRALHYLGGQCYLSFLIAKVRQLRRRFEYLQLNYKATSPRCVYRRWLQLHGTNANAEFTHVENVQWGVTCLTCSLDRYTRSRHRINSSIHYLARFLIVSSLQTFHVVIYNVCGNLCKIQWVLLKQIINLKT